MRRLVKVALLAAVLAGAGSAQANSRPDTSLPKGDWCYARNPGGVLEWFPPWVRWYTC